MGADELRAKNSDELHKEILELAREAFNLRMQKGSGQLSRPNRMRAVRRDIARIKTILNERAMEGAL